MMSLKHKKVAYYSAAAILPAILFIVISYCVGIYPIGAKSIITWDMNGQYDSFLSYYRRVLLSGNLLQFYNGSIALGAPNGALFGYYLLSPYNLLLCFFASDQIPLGIWFIILCKYVSCGLSMSMFLRYRIVFLKKYAKTDGADIFYVWNILLSVIYAYMGYNVCYQFNLMWLDGCILLPIVAIGVYKAVDENSDLLLILTLCMALISNFYVGYMLIGFSFAFYMFVINEIRIRRTSVYQVMNKSVGVYIIRYIGLVFITLGICAAVLLPIVHGLVISRLSYKIADIELMEKVLMKYEYPLMIAVVLCGVIVCYLILAGTRIFSFAKARPGKKGIFHYEFHGRMMDIPVWLSDGTLWEV